MDPIHALALQRWRLLHHDHTARAQPGYQGFELPADHPPALMSSLWPRLQAMSCSIVVIGIYWVGQRMFFHIKGR